MEISRREKLILSEEAQKGLMRRRLLSWCVLNYPMNPDILISSLPSLLYYMPPLP